MPRPADPKRNAAIAAMIDMSHQYGIKNGLAIARERFPGIPNATWARWRNAALGSVDASKADADAVVGLSSEVRAEIPALHEIAPAVSNPFQATQRALKFWKMMDELEVDCQLMRDFALGKDENGKTKIKVPTALRDAHKMRCDLIRLLIQQADTVWSAERAATFYQAIMEEIAAESHDCQRRIMERLQRMQGEAAERGF